MMFALALCIGGVARPGPRCGAGGFLGLLRRLGLQPSTGGLPLVSYPLGHGRNPLWEASIAADNRQRARISSPAYHGTITAITGRGGALLRATKRIGFARIRADRQ
jgi:hypothetical protein